MASKFDKEETYDCDTDTGAEDSSGSCTSSRSPSPEPTDNLRGGGPQAPHDRVGYRCGHYPLTHYVEFTCNDYMYMDDYCYYNTWRHCPRHRSSSRKLQYIP